MRVLLICLVVIAAQCVRINESFAGPKQYRVENGRLLDAPTMGSEEYLKYFPRTVSKVADIQDQTKAALNLILDPTTVLQHGVEAQQTLEKLYRVADSLYFDWKGFIRPPEYDGADEMLGQVLDHLREWISNLSLFSVTGSSYYSDQAYFHEIQLNRLATKMMEGTKK